MPKDKGGNPNLIAKSPNPSQASSGYHNLEDLGISKDFNRSQVSTSLKNIIKIHAGHRLVPA